MSVTRKVEFIVICAIALYAWLVLLEVVGTPPGNVVAFLAMIGFTSAAMQRWERS